MKVGNYVFMTVEHETNCGGIYPKNAIGKLVSEEPDKDNEVEVHFPTHIWENNSSYILLDKIQLVPADRIEEAEKKFLSAKEEQKHALLD